MNEIKQTNENSIEEIFNELQNVNFDYNEIESRGFRELPVSSLMAFGASFEPLMNAISRISGSETKTMIAKVTYNKNGSLMKFKDGTGLGGTVIGSSKAFVEQARINPLGMNPELFIMLVALSIIDNRLSEIEELQKDIYDFLVQKEKSELRGNLKFLMDIYNDYKMNVGNDQFKQSNHIKALDIRQNSEAKIDFYKEQIKKATGKKSLINIDMDVKKQVGKVTSLFQEYQISVYLFAFSSFMEVLLLENFSSNYLDSIRDRIEEKSLEYREIYSNVYNKLEKMNNSSIESNLLKGVSGINKLGNLAAQKIQVMKKIKADEISSNISDFLDEMADKRTKELANLMLKNQSAYVRPFIENINVINEKFNNDVETLIYDGKIYIK